MSTAIVDGGPAWSDGADPPGQYRNRIETDRVRLWHHYGRRQGILRGGDLSTVAGQMVIEVAPFLAVVEERDAAGNRGTDRGYEVWVDATAVASFDVASASDRMDALVVAFCDPEAGAAAFGTETSVTGGQVVVVPGVSGTTTPRTDTQIQDAVGSGGWQRVADVLIASTDTEINPANITEDPAADGRTPFVEAWSDSATRAPGVRNAVRWDHVEEVQGGIAVGTNANAFTLPAGLYQIDMSADSRDSSGSWAAAFLVDADTSTGLLQGVVQRSGSIESVGFHKVLRIADGQRIQVDLQAAGGNDVDTVFAGGRDRFYFTAHRIGD